MADKAVQVELEGLDELLEKFEKACALSKELLTTIKELNEIELTTKIITKGGNAE